MPELPEVETIRRDLEKEIVGKKISDFEIRLPQRFYFGKVQPSQAGSKLSQKEAEKISQKIIGEEITEIRRKGKLLILLYKNWAHLIHLKLTGQLIYQASKGKFIQERHPISDLVKNLPSKAVNFIWIFKDKSRLYFNDFRKFGYLHLVAKNQYQKLPAFENLGPDALSSNFSLNYFQDQIKNKKTKICPYP